jgi:fido (protein-threonine AMPylation protein)
LRFVKGPGALRTDPPFMGVRCSSQARAFLENLNPKGAARALPRADIEQRLEHVLHVNGEAGLNALRDDARAVAAALGWATELKQLDSIVGALLGTRTQRLRGAVARARAAGKPFDPRCVERLNILGAELRAGVGGIRESSTNDQHATNKAFFEAYFSNYIEGTRFDIEEAEAIVFDKQIPASRAKDGHDILGTFAIVSDPQQMRRTPEDPAKLQSVLKERHRRMLAERPEALPGMFKSKVNYAGDTQFVHPDYVEGTLDAGFALYKDLPPGLARAIFVMFLVSDVHPFVDGNGRAARIMMNAELTAAGESTIIIPTVFRDDYLQALRALTRRHRPAPLVRALVYAQRFSTLEFAPYPRILAELTRRNWFREPDDAKIIADPFPAAR